MRKINCIDVDPQQMNIEYRAVDWKDINGLIEAIDDEMRNYGLELTVADYGDDNWWVKVTYEGHER